MPRRLLQGTVVSNKMDKTAVVRVERRMKHPLFGKFITKSKKYHAHDENNTAVEGSVVSIVECKPISKNKRFSLVEANDAKKEA